MAVEQVAQAKRMAQRRSARAKAAQIEPAAFKAYEATIYLGGISMPSLFDFVRRGLLRPNKHFGHLLFSRKTLDKFLEQTRTDTRPNGATKRRKTT
jgi:hypothetical protein